MTKKPQRLSDEIRAALKMHLETASKRSVCMATGLQSTQITRFVKGVTGLTMANMDKLADHLGLHLRGQGNSVKP